MGVRFNDGKHSYPMDQFLKRNLDDMRKAINRKGFDIVLGIDGYVGGGKSTLGQQVAYYVDPTFNDDRVCFEPQDFMNKLLKLKKGQAIIFDEALSGMDSRRSMSQMNVLFRQLFAELRQRNLFVIIILPSIFDLDKSQALFRMRSLIHVVTKGFRRGFFRYYDRQAKNMLYLTGKKTYQYKWKSNFSGEFSGYSVIDKELYEKKKGDYLKRFAGDVMGPPKKPEQIAKEKEEELLALIAPMFKKYGITPTGEIAEKMKITQRTVQDRIKRGRDRQKNSQDKDEPKVNGASPSTESRAYPLSNPVSPVTFPS